MASSPFEELARVGLALLDRDQVSELAHRLRAQQADKRGTEFADVIEEVERWRDSHEESGGVPRAALNEIDETLQDAAGMVLSGSPPEHISELLARVPLLLTGSDIWLKRRQATRHEFE